MSIDARLARLAPALSAQERAILILEAWKDGRPEDPSWRRTLPPDQSHAFNRYIDLMNQANPVLGHLLTAAYHQARELELREAWLIDMTLWQEHVEDIQAAVRLAVDEPITQSEYDAKLAAAHAEWVPIEEIAAFLTTYRNDWCEDDYEPGEDGSEPVIKDEAWDRAAGEEEKKLRALVADRVLPSKGRGKALKLRADAVCHFGHEVAPASEDYLAYRVLPDEQAEAVDVERFALRRLQDTLSWSRPGDDEDELPRLPDKIRASLRESLAFGLVLAWVQLRSIDAVLGEIAEEFNGNDPLRPVLRTKLETTREKLLTVQEHLLMFKLEVALREPLEEEQQEMRDWMAEVPKP